MLSISQPLNPVSSYGDKSLNIDVLQRFCDEILRNFTSVQMEIYRMDIELTDTKIQNQKMAQLLNWIAVTNPQILDEFQTTATAFEQLVPRNGTGSDESVPTTADV